MVFDLASGKQIRYYKVKNPFKKKVTGILRFPAPT